MKKKVKILDKEEIFNQLKINLISKFYPLSNEDIIKYKKKLNFDRYHLMTNENINWNIELIKLVIDKIDCTAFWKLKNITFDITFFDTFDKVIDYSSIQLSRNIIWDDKLVEKYGDKFDWSTYLINREYLCKIENIRRFKDNFNWSYISQSLNLNLDYEIIEEFKEYWDWSKLSLNKNLPISLDFLERYKDKLDFENLSKNPTCIDIILKHAKSKRWNWNNVLVNPGLEYNDKNFELVYHYYSKYYPVNLSNNPYRNNRIIFNFLKRVFHFPSTQKSYFVSDKFIRWFPWDSVSKSNIVLDIDTIMKYKDQINFKENNFLQTNGSLLDKDFISNNIDLFNLKSYRFYHLNLDTSFINKHINDLDWFCLSSCEKIEWDWEFIIDNYEKLHFHRLSDNKAVYDNLIKNIMSNEEVFSFLDSNI